MGGRTLRDKRRPRSQGKVRIPLSLCVLLQPDHSLIALLPKILADNQTESQWRRLGWRLSDRMIPGHMIMSKGTVLIQLRHVLPLV